ncbi:hypothetical protein A2841_00075 [Candidatus Kaiserbacteria bacterium RIFCSPHIGHO2_01_FULL_48_10]|uniref:Uncharacterized protein n=1 Tax=Candidatus Kaiserbacteria bacterium RIFCSPHIGHO2_01_FULL_48_10 TaxID=1798476 RepID=A0A1F6C5M6_9BACT|nr:MAG: hypothetical protein A2841_00075 [Candidatus Kaiserbacteria bacterium RIFCSPHIGHO2_01_FULL_48_10]HLC99550.1 hypothetical protein [Patescibacteria group bacterium]
MNTVFGWGKEGQTLNLEACPKIVWTGISEVADPDTPGGVTLFPEIDLYYEPRDLPIVLAIAEEMKRLNQQPSLYMNLVGRLVDTMIVFRLKAENLSFLKQFMKPDFLSLFEAIAGEQGLHIVVSSSTDVSGDLLPTLMEFQQRKGFIALRIVEAVMDKPRNPRTLWVTQLLTINWGPLPSPLEF